MESRKADRRVRRTEESLRRALQSLVKEKGYSRVTVQDILDRADVGRSTFYAHYRDKDDLLLRGFDDIRFSLTETPAEAAGRSVFLQPLRSVFEHVERYRDTWTPMAQKGGSEIVVDILRETTESVLRDHLRTQQGPGANPQALEAATQYAVGGLISLIRWWLDYDVPLTAEELHTVFRRLATRDIRRFLAAGA